MKNLIMKANPGIRKIGKSVKGLPRYHFRTLVLALIEDNGLKKEDIRAKWNSVGNKYWQDIYDDLQEEIRIKKENPVPALIADKRIEKKGFIPKEQPAEEAEQEDEKQDDSLPPVLPEREDNLIDINDWISDSGSGSELDEPKPKEEIKAEVKAVEPPKEKHREHRHRDKKKKHKKVVVESESESESSESEEEETELETEAESVVESESESESEEEVKPKKKRAKSPKKKSKRVKSKPLPIPKKKRAPPTRRKPPAKMKDLIDQALKEREQEKSKPSIATAQPAAVHPVQQLLGLF